MAETYVCDEFTIADIDLIVSLHSIIKGTIVPTITVAGTIIHLIYLVALFKFHTLRTIFTNQVLALHLSVLHR